MRLMLEYDWPGNVRELQHAIERTCAMSSGPVLHTVDLPTQLQDFRAHRREADGPARTEAGGSAGGHGQPPSSPSPIWRGRRSWTPSGS